MDATDYWKQGMYKAAADYGVTKVALLGGAVGILKSMKPTARGVGNFLWGKPGQFVKELKAGKALHREGLIRRGMAAPGIFNKALFYGLPAVEAGKVVTDDQGDKAARIGSLAGGTLLGTAAFGPGGMIGAMGAGLLGDAVGSRVGAGVGHITGVGNKIDPPPRFQPQQPWQY